MEKKVSYFKDLNKNQIDAEGKIVKKLKFKIPNSSTGRPRGIKLSKYIWYNIDDATKTLHLYIQQQIDNRNGENKKLFAVCNNMQTDNAAFEGWAICLKAMLPDLIEKVELKWDIPLTGNLHYNRFLYRVSRFCEKYPWFTIDESNATDVKNFLENRWKSLTINVSNVEPDKKSNDENAVEYEIVDKKKDDIRKSFMQKYGLWLFNHQLPVGVKSNNSLLFTGGQSAIDLWSVSNDGKELSVYELKYINNQKKGSKNIKVGIISELFLYVCVMEDIIKGNIKPENPILPDEKNLYDNIKKIKQISAVMLSNEFHPLVYSKSVLDLLNSPRNSNIPIINFKLVFYSYKRGSYEFDFVSEM